MAREGSRTPSYRPGVWMGLDERQRLEVCLGAILTQNAAWTNAARALENLHGRSAVDLGRLGRLRPCELGALIRPSGYFRQKALKLKAFARHALSRGAGAGQGLGGWLSGPLPALRDELLGIFGVGPETADSILLYAGGRPAFVVDAYTLRVGSRVGWFGPKAPYAQAQAFLAGSLPRSPRLYGEFHALIVELAKRHCRKTPACEGCPLRPACRHAGRRHD